MNRKILIIAIVTLFIDQISKVIIETLLRLNEEFIVIQNFFSLHYINNYGAAWSIFDNKIPLIIVFSLFALVIIYHFMYSFQKNKRNTLAFGLVFAGIVGNLMDRWLLGYVRDFLSFNLFGYQYPIFNIADSAIVIGVLLLIVAIFKGEDHIEKDSSTK